MAKSTFIYVTYIRTTPEKLWQALTEPAFMRQYWFDCFGESEWVAGSPWRLVSSAGATLDDGEIVEAVPPRKLVIRWQHQTRPEVRAEGYSLCAIEIEPSAGSVRLTIKHSIDRDPSKFIEAVSGGWPKVLSNLKSLLETGSIALTEAYPAAKDS